MLHDAPRFGPAAAAQLARDHFGIDGTARPLPSERDQNFLIAGPDGDQVVLKIANGTEQRAVLEAQHAALAHLAGHGTLTPRTVAVRGGGTIVEAAMHGRRHFAWAITWIDGVPLATARWRSPALLEDLGRRTGELRRALNSFDHPAVHRDFYWDLANARRTVADDLRLIGDPDVRATVDRLADAFDRDTAPAVAALPRGVVHGDLNDYNVLVTTSGGAETTNQRIAGFVDLGDMVYSVAIADLAIASAYAMLGQRDALAAAAHLVRGYHAVCPLTEGELAALFGLTAMRLSASVCIAARQQSERPDNDYLGISQQAIRATLPVLARVPFRLAEAVFRNACRFPPIATSERVVTWLRRSAKTIAPVLGVDLRTEPCIVLDLSVAGPVVSGDLDANAEPMLTPRVFGAMRDAGVDVSVGRYDEPRLLYLTPAFAGGERLTDERRTVHIGLDLFAVAGTPVFAPIAGAVHALADNAAPLDYGPVIILRHATDDGTEFFTLYGHLSRESIATLEVGRSVVAGEQIATLGTPSVNGGWTPHLHLQIIADLFDLGTDFPGVALANQRDVWRSVSPDPNLLVGIPADPFPSSTPTTSTTLAARHDRLGHNLSIAYAEPVKIVRGWKQYLFDDTGRKYVDAYNNVPHVGHCHPRVAEAGAAQMRLLNTNTRYLSDLLAEYAHRLSDTLPAPLRVCYFVNSASEANELALRLARAYTGARDMIVLEAAYHGNTTTLIDLSPYKHAGPGGAGAPDWVHVAPLPDDYRGPYKRGDADAGRKYASHVGEIVRGFARDNRRLAGFIAESCPSVGGQIVFPPGYLREVYEHVRGAGGVCIADEVQTGLGRMGTHFWAFEAQQVVPDIVVAGKPLGNGHPIGAVVTTREIADAFDNGMEFFSTFGGNTVSCAIGLAVLDVLRDEDLQANARRVGERMLAGLGRLADRHPIIGDVRGSGLFLGAELVRDRQTLDPAGEEAAFIANRMREQGVLLGTDGPYHNVVKIRPPMPFGDSDADLLIEVLDAALDSLPAANERRGGVEDRLG